MSFQFEDFDKSGKPYGARVTRIRDDMSWIDALQAPRQSSIHGMNTQFFVHNPDFFSNNHKQVSAS